MSGVRWTEEQVADYERRFQRDGGTLGTHRVPAPSRAPHTAPTHSRAPPARGSRLESELAGHLSVMGLRPETQYRFHPERRWRLDFAFPDELVAVELDGGIFAAENGGEIGKHARGAGRCKDMEKRNAAAEVGWLVLTYGPPHVRSGEAALQIERVLLARRASLATGGPGFALVRELDAGGRDKGLEEQKPRKRVGRRGRKRDSELSEIPVPASVQIA